MSLVINWIDLLPEQVSHCYRISLPMGSLVIYQVDDVVTKTEWSFDTMSHEPPFGNKQCDDIQRYLSYPDYQLNINLQKQGSQFRNKVWAEMCKIPAGQVATYSDLAKSIGSGARAVANACRNNAFPAIIPCHRVVSISGLGGYMGETSGKCMDIKIALLEMEAKA